MLILLFKIIAQIPLPILHQIAKPLGYLMYHFAPTERRKIQHNLTIAQLPNTPQNVLAVCQETIKSGLELPIAFFRQPEHITQLFKNIHGWEHVQHAIQNQMGILFITPHLGSYDLAGRYISENLPFPLTAMYKPPKIKIFDHIMQIGRVRGKGKTAPTNIMGVKQIIKALRQAQATIILPDHVPDPKEGDGVWVHFFNHPAYTMTLAAKLANMKHVQTLFFVGERLPNGQGFNLHIKPLTDSLNNNPHHDTQIINNHLENWITQFPNQYLFAYNRYKNPTPHPPNLTPKS